MKLTLHITNGDSVAETLREAAIPGQVVPWRDVLHEGPVPNVDIASLRRVRAEFLQRYTSESIGTIEGQLEQRDALLLNTEAFDRRLLWFEHDLYDQLQLLQILDALSTIAPPCPTALICIDRFPNVERFKGLGQLSAQQLLTLPARQVEVSSSMLELAQEGWAAFRSDDPTRIEAFLATDTSALPFLKPALERFLEQYPAVENGLSGNESLILKSLANRPATAETLFVSDWEGNRPSYLGDLSFFDILESLFPLIAHENGEPFTRSGDAEGLRKPLMVTRLGFDVLEGKRDALDIRGIDRWLGGVHLTEPYRGWRWDAAARKLRFRVS